MTAVGEEAVDSDIDLQQKGLPVVKSCQFHLKRQQNTHVIKRCTARRHIGGAEVQFSALHGGECSAARLGLFTPTERKNWHPTTYEADRAAEAF